jgi:hypothetical protein
LVYYFESNLFQNNKILYSHFDFVCHYGLVIIRVYLYFVGFFGHLGSFFSELNEEFFFLRSKKEFSSNLKARKASVAAAGVFVFFKLVSGYDISMLVEKRVLDAFFSFDFFLLKKLLFSKRYLYVDEDEKFDFLFFFSILLFLASEFEKERVYLNSILERLFVSVVSYVFWRPLLLKIRFFVLSLINYLFLNFESKLSLNFYFLSNEGLSSKFISRFIAVRLSYNLPLSEVVDPIKADLISSMGIVIPKSKARQGGLRLGSVKIFYKGVFKRLTLIFVSLYWKLLAKYFSKSFS